MSKQRDQKTGKFVRTKPDYKAMYEELQKEKEILVQTAQDNYLRLEHEYDKLQIKVADYGMRLKFLLNHCGPICKWMFKRKFVKE